MRVTTRIKWDMLTGKVLEHESFEYSGRIAFCKGDSTAQAAEQQQAAFDSQLMTIFQAQYGKQQDVFNFLKGTLSPMISKPTGYSDAELAAQRTGATDAISSEFQNAQKTLQNNETAKNGGSDLPSGTNAQLDAALLGEEAQTKAGAQEQITAANANLKQQNYWAAIDALNGQEAQLNPLGYASAATSGSGAVSNLSQAVTQANGPGIGSILGGVAGAGLSGWASGGFKMPCYVAAAVFNEDFYTGPKTNAVRNWLFNTWSKNWYAKPVLSLYAKYGQALSKSAFAVRVLAPLFHKALRKAQGEK